MVRSGGGVGRIGAGIKTQISSRPYTGVSVFRLKSDFRFYQNEGNRHKIGNIDIFSLF